jgi:hypothetical protein
MGIRTKVLHYLALSGCDAAAGKRHAWPPPYTDDQLAAPAIPFQRHVIDRSRILNSELAIHYPAPRLSPHAEVSRPDAGMWKKFVLTPILAARRFRISVTTNSLKVTGFSRPFQRL